MKEPRLQMRLKKQLSGGRVPHLLWGQGAGSPQPGGSGGHGPALPPVGAHLTRGMWSSVQQESGLSTSQDWL